MMTLAQVLQALEDLRGETEEHAAIRRRKEPAPVGFLADLPTASDYIEDAAARMREAEDLLRVALGMIAE